MLFICDLDGTLIVNWDYPDAEQRQPSYSTSWSEAYSKSDQRHSEDFKPHQLNQVYFLYPQAMSAIFGWIAKYHHFAFITDGTYPRAMLKVMIEQVYQLPEAAQTDFLYFNAIHYHDSHYLDFCKLLVAENQDYESLPPRVSALMWMRFQFLQQGHLPLPLSQQSQCAVIDDRSHYFGIARSFGFQTIHAGLSSRVCMVDHINHNLDKMTYAQVEFLIELAKISGLHQNALSYSHAPATFALNLQQADISLIQTYITSDVFLLWQAMQQAQTQCLWKSSLPTSAKYVVSLAERLHNGELQISPLPSSTTLLLTTQHFLSVGPPRT